MTEEERLKDKQQVRRTMVLVVIGFAIFIGYQFTRLGSSNKSVDSTSYSNTSYGNTSQTEEETTGGVCDECGRHFSGRGYTEVSEGVWQETQEPYQSFICSKSCGLKHTGNWNNILGKSDGKVYDKEPCGMCNGTGIEEVHNSLGDQSRVCPMCDGKGYKSY